MFVPLVEVQKVVGDVIAKAGSKVNKISGMQTRASRHSGFAWDKFVLRGIPQS
jgi:hypothetical protein